MTERQRTSGLGRLDITSNSSNLEGLLWIVQQIIHYAAALCTSCTGDDNDGLVYVRHGTEQSNGIGRQAAV
jgi:hypothetical protein